jgi:F-type H+-transporting ATPase subunit epsilon
MEPDKIDFEVATPERLVLSETVDEVVLPGTEGYLGVLPGHAPLLTSLRPGEIAYRVGNAHRYVAVSTGFAEVLRNRVSILADTAERAEEIDVERARRSKERAERELTERESEHAFREAEARLYRALARIRVAERRIS